MATVPFGSPLPGSARFIARLSDRLTAGYPISNNAPPILNGADRPKAGVLFGPVLLVGVCGL